MASDLNSISITGRLVGEPKFFVNNETMKIIGFGIANNIHIKDKIITSFLNCKCFIGKLSEVIGKSCHKGDLVGIEGEIRQEQWETKEGDKRNDFVIIISKIKFLSPPKKENSQPDFNSLPTGDDLFI